MLGAAQAPEDAEEHRGLHPPDASRTSLPSYHSHKVSGSHPMSLGARSPRVENPGDNHQAAGTHLAEGTGQISPSPAAWPLAQSLPSSRKGSGLSQATTPLPKAFVNSTPVPTRWDLMTQTRGSQRRRCPG